MQRDTLSAGRTYSDAEVAHVLALAYETGRRHAAAEDIAEVVGCWQEYAQPSPTREQRVAQRVAAYEKAAERLHARLGRPPGYRYNGGPVDWDTGLPVRNLRKAA